MHWLLMKESTHTFCNQCMLTPILTLESKATAIFLVPGLVQCSPVINTLGQFAGYVTILLMKSLQKIPYIRRVGQNHIYTVYILYFWQKIHQIYGHIRCIYTVLANPIYTPLVLANSINSPTTVAATICRLSLGGSCDHRLVCFFTVDD